MNESFQRGFIKAALANGVDPLLAVRLLKQAEDMDQTMSTNMFADAIPQGLMGAGIGAAGGGLAGYFAGRNKQDPSKDHRILGALGGATLGGLGGSAIGGYHGANQGYHETLDPTIDNFQNSIPEKIYEKLTGGPSTQMSQFELMKHQSLLQALLRNSQ